MLTNYSLFHGKPTVDYCFSIFSDAQFIILLLGLVAVAFPYTYHGCAMAPNSEHGWVVTSDTVLVLHTWDGGANWEEQHLPLPFHYYFFDVFFLTHLKAGQQTDWL